MRTWRRREEGGFTLIELLVVIVIIGLLAAIAVPIFLSQRQKGYDAQAKADLRELADNEESFLVAMDAYGTLAELQANGAQITLSKNVTLSVVRYNRDASYCLSARHSGSPITWYWDSLAGGLQGATSAGCPLVTSGTPGDSLP